MKKWILSISIIISFLLFLVLLVSSKHIVNSLQDQNMAKRWSTNNDASQVSSFFSYKANFDVNAIELFRHTLDQDLVEAAIESTSENENARLWMDAYSGEGSLTLKSGKISITADAMGVGGDFFAFHPVKLIYGSYFSEHDLMQDYCIIDEDAAWQLFGSNDVVGMMVTISDIPHIVIGVAERQKGKLSDAAGLDSTLVYVSYETLKTYGNTTGINHYEIVMPNPVKDYAYSYMKEKITVDKKEVEIVENTTRYSLKNRIEGLKEFGTRSMNGKAIAYPYWENIARGYEDIILCMTVFMLLFMGYPTLIIIIWCCKLWKHKRWTIKSVYLYIQDKTERFFEKKREQKKLRKGETYEKNN